LGGVVCWWLLLGCAAAEFHRVFVFLGVCFFLLVVVWGRWRPSAGGIGASKGVIGCGSGLREGEEKGQEKRGGVACVDKKKRKTSGHGREGGRAEKKTAGRKKRKAEKNGEPEENKGGRRKKKETPEGGGWGRVGGMLISLWERVMGAGWAPGAGEKV